jgi:preprotein translocase subunit SecD
MNFRVFIFILTLIFGVGFSIPSFLNTDYGKKINLGLDLQGGLHLLLGVEKEKALESKMNSVSSSISYFADKKEIYIDSLELKNNIVKFTLLDSDDITQIDEFLTKIDHIATSKNGENYIINLTPEGEKAIQNQALNQAVETIRNRLDQFGLSEPTVARQGEDKILVEIPGIKTQEEEQRARKLISQSAQLYLMSVDEARNSRAFSMSENEARSYGDTILPDAQDENIKFLVKKIAILDGSKLTDAQVAFNEMNSPVISFDLNSEGAEIFGNYTSKNVGNRLAIVLDGKVISAPTIQERIGGGSGQISGQFSLIEAQDLAISLRSGALLAPVYVMEKRSVGPSLGADSIKSALMALIGGFILVVFFMILYYNMAGVISNIALIVNLFVIIAVMSLFGATLTLPGMAGIVLTVGMAVDANVIINERIRELIYSGSTISKAIEDGYKNATTAILDANLTTLIAAIVLYAYGNTSVKGFAVTIAIGIIASMLTAIVGTRGIYEMSVRSVSKKGGKWFGVAKIYSKNSNI